MSNIHSILQLEGSEIPRFEAELLLAHAIAKTRAFVLAHPEQVLTKNSRKKISVLIERRKNHEPIALIIGKKEFYGREFFINRHTLVPRPETELLLEKTLEHIAKSKKENFSKAKRRVILDIGTGSGNIITTLVKEIETETILSKNFSFVATDISREALRVARKNARKHDAKKYILFFHSNLLKKIPKKIFQDAQEIIFLANLPYLSKKEYITAPPDVRNFEPKSALESGENGLNHYRELLEEVRESLRKKDFTTSSIGLFFEISPTQKNSLKELVSHVFPKARIEFFRDLAKKWRMARILL